jgi:tape measure domain-containing protein
MSGARNEAVTALVYDARPAQQGAQQFEAASRQIIQANTGVTTATTRTVDASASMERALTRLTRQIDPAAAAQARLEAGQRLLDRAFQRGRITAEEQARSLALLEARFASAAAGAGRLSAANDNATRGFGLLSSAAGGAAGALGGLGAALTSPAAAVAALGAGAVLGARQIATIGDAYTTTMNRLQAATGSVQAATAVYGQLLALSQQTGAAIGQSADAFARFSVAARGIGATNEQVVALTRTIQQAALIAGASTQEMASVTLQLGQGLAAGTVQGEELRSIMEGMPTLAEALARELGVSIGQLREMSSAGELTSERVFQAILRASEGINRQFDNLTPTMGRAFGILGAAMTDFVGRLDQALGLSQGIARAAMAAANAVRGAAGTFFPDEGSRAAADVQGSLSRQQSLEAQIAAAAGGAAVRPGSIPRGAQIAGGSAAGNADRLAELRQQLAAEQAVYAEAQERVERLRAEGFLSQQAEEDAAARRRLEAQRTAATTQFNAARTALDREAKAREDHAKRLEAIDAGLNAGQTDAAGAARLRALANEELATALRRVEGSARAATDVLREYATLQRTASGLLAGNASDEAAIREIQQLARGTALDPARFARQEREARQAEEVQRRSLERQEQEANRTTDRITDFFGNAFARAFESTGGGFSSLMDSFRRAAISTFASIAAQAIIRPIIAPIFGGASGGLGSLGSLFGSSGSGSALGGASGGGFGLDQILSGAGLGRSLFGGSGGSMFGGFGQSVNNFLATPLYTPPFATGGFGGFSPGTAMAGEAGAFAGGGAGGSALSVGSTLGAIGGIGAGAFGIYSGIRQGGIGGAVTGIGGGLGMAAGLATLTGIGASLAPILGPAALLLGIVGSLLPGQKPPSRMQGAGANFGTDAAPTSFGFDGAKFSAGNRGQADSIAASIFGQERALAQQLGFAASGAFDVRVEDDRKGGSIVQLQMGRHGGAAMDDGFGGLFGGGGSAFPTRTFTNDEAGLRELSAYASEQLFQAFRATAENLSSEMSSIVLNSADLEALAGNLEFFNGAYRSLSDITALTDTWTGALRDLNAPFDAAIAKARELGLSTQNLADAQAAVVADAERRRQLQIGGIMAGLGVREANLRGDVLGAALLGFDAQAAQQVQQMRDALRDVGVTGETAAQTLARTERILAEERLALQREYGEAMRQSYRGVIDWLNNQRLGANSSLSPFAQMQEAERQFRAAQEANDLAGLTRAGDALLTSSRSVLGGATEAYSQREMFVRATVAQTGQRAAAAAGDQPAVAALQAEINRLNDTVIALRQSMQQMADNMQRSNDRAVIAA